MITFEHGEYTNGIFIVKEDLSDYVMTCSNYWDSEFYRIYDEHSFLKQYTIAPTCLGFWSFE